MKFLLLSVLLTSSLSGKEVANNPVIGNPQATKGGTFVWGGLSYPKSLNYPISGDAVSKMLYELVVENLCQANLESGEYVPLLAESWQVSADQKVFTFHLNKKARFSDGTKVTTKDVKAFWDIVQDKSNLVGPVRASLDRFSKLEIIDNYTFKLYAKEARFSNFDSICQYFSVTSHKFYLGKNFNKAFNNKLFGSGPYRLKSVNKGKKVVLVRNKNYWGKDLPQNIGRFNFDTFVYRVVNDLTVRFEVFKKGNIDMISFNVAKRWKTETNSEKFKKNWIIAQRVDNKEPRGFSGVIINTRRQPLDNLLVRKALAHTYNRKKFIKDLFYDSYQRHNSYFPNSIFANPNNKMIDFDIKKARKFLREAGYSKTNNNGILIDKTGEAFRLIFLYTSKTTERYLTIWKEDLRKVGIDLQLKQITWPTLVKKWDKYDFELAGILWNGALNPDPREMWYSKYRDQPSGNNLAGFVSPQLDKLIKDIGPVFDRTERAKLFQQMDTILFDNHPYILSWGLSYQRIAYWNKFSFIPQVIPTYASYLYAWQYTWHDKDKNKKLRQAMKAGKALPAPRGVRGPND